MSANRGSRHRRTIGEIVETARYAPGDLLRDGVKRVVHATLGGRPAWLRALRQREQQRPLRGPLVLMYHRIAADDPDPWALSVSPEHFAQQMEVIAKTRRPIALTKCVSDGQAAELPADAIVVTFDDGYADNLLAAKPILERFGIPATVFVTTVAVDHPQELWWDELERLVLMPDQLPSLSPLCIDGQEVPVPSDTNSREPLAARRAAFVRQEGDRWAVYNAVYKAIIERPYPQKTRVLNDLRKVLSSAHGGPSERRLLTRSEFQQLASGDLIDIGGHTDTHALLSSLSMGDQKNEIISNKSFLEGLLQQPVSSFAYPYGNYDAQTILCLRQAGFSVACHTRPGTVQPGGSPFKLPRLHVLDWDYDQFSSVLGTATHVAT